MNTGKIAAMKAFKKAMADDDAKGMAEAFSSAYDLCAAEYEAEEKAPPSKKPGGLAILIGKAGKDKE